MRQVVSVGLVSLALGAGLGACASQSSAPSAPAPAPSDSVWPTPATAEPAPPAPPAPPSATVAPAPPTPPAASLVSICLAKCDQLVAKCAKTAVESCRLNCTKYEPPGSECVEQTRSALECSRDAKDLTCANVAPESCGPKFRAIAKCLAGEAAHEAATPAGLPPGWERVTDSANGFSLALPNGSAVTAGPEGPVRSVTAPDGTKYSVSVLPLLKEKATQKALLHFLMRVMGRCSDKVKMDGFIEKPGQTSIHYIAHCPDKTDWNGMIFIDDRHLILLSAQAPTGKIGPTEPFLYQFEFAR